MPSKLSRLGDRQILKAFAERAPGGPGFAILAALLAHADENFIAWPGYGTIARIANVSTRTVERWIPELERAGFFRRRIVASGGRRDHTRYDMSAFVQQALAFHTDAESVRTDRESARNGASVPTERRALTDREAAPVPTESRAKKPLKKPRKKPADSARARTRDKRRASKRCPDNFALTDDLLAWAAEKFPVVDAVAATEAFRDHEFQRALTDWPAAWRNWIRKEATFNGRGNTRATRKLSYVEQLAADMAAKGMR